MRYVLFFIAIVFSLEVTNAQSQTFEIFGNVGTEYSVPNNNFSFYLETGWGYQSIQSSIFFSKGFDDVFGKTNNIGINAIYVRNRLKFYVILERILGSEFDFPPIQDIKRRGKAIGTGLRFSINDRYWVFANPYFTWFDRSMLKISDSGLPENWFMSLKISVGVSIFKKKL